MNTVKSMFKRAFFKEPKLSNIQIRRYCEAEWGPNAEYVYQMMVSGATMDEIRKGLR